jgi:hypothetical protein
MIEKELALNDKIEWQELPEKKASRIRIFHDHNFEDEESWNNAFKWLVETALKFRKVFSQELGKEKTP